MDQVVESLFSKCKALRKTEREREREREWGQGGKEGGGKREGGE
jgi:hypothetical protein